MNRTNDTINRDIKASATPKDSRDSKSTTLDYHNSSLGTNQRYLSVNKAIITRHLGVEIVIIQFWLWTNETEEKVFLSVDGAILFCQQHNVKPPLRSQFVFVAPHTVKGATR